MLLAAIKDLDIYNRTQPSSQLSDDAQIIALLRKLIKQRHQSIQMYTEGNRPELASKEQAEIEIIETLLPKNLSAAEIESIVQKYIQKESLSSPKDMGKIIQYLKTSYPTTLDAGLAAQITKKALSS